MTGDSISADRCNVGDPNPTRDMNMIGRVCEDEHDSYLCTRERGHGGQHVAGAGEVVAATWHDRPTQMTGDDGLRAALEQRGLDPLVALLVTRDDVDVLTLDVHVGLRRITFNAIVDAEILAEVTA